LAVQHISTFLADLLGLHRVCMIAFRKDIAATPETVGDVTAALDGLRTLAPRLSLPWISRLNEQVCHL
jgi:hypothetical protein